jgi:hypothetical protein
LSEFFTGHNIDSIPDDRLPDGGPHGRTLRGSFSPLPVSGEAPPPLLGASSEPETRLTRGKFLKPFFVPSCLSAKNVAFFDQTTASFCKNVSITLVFEKNGSFFSENWQKFQTIVIITSSSSSFMDRRKSHVAAGPSVRLGL